MMHRRLTCALVLVATGCATHHSTSSTVDYGIDPCPAGAEQHLLSPDALQCWFDAPNGRWRTLSHESHFAVLVVNVQAADIRDAEAIAGRFVRSEQQTFSEILVYVQEEVRRDGSSIRRVRWTPDGGYEALDFETPKPEA